MFATNEHLLSLETGLTFSTLNTVILASVILTISLIDGVSLWSFLAGSIFVASGGLVPIFWSGIWFETVLPTSIFIAYVGSVLITTLYFKKSSRSGIHPLVNDVPK